MTVLSSRQANGLPGVLLWNVAKLWQKHVHTAVAPLGLSSTNAVILVNILHLSLEEQRISQTAAAELSNVDVMTTSSALRTLEKKQLVVRTMDTSDRRSNVLALTAQGRETALAAVDRLAHAHQQFFSVISSEQAHFSATLSLLLQKHGHTLFVNSDETINNTGEVT